MPVSHLFEPQHLAGTSCSAYHTHARAHKQTHPLSLSWTHTHTHQQTGIASDTSSVRQLWDWAQKWGLSLTANHSVCVFTFMSSIVKISQCYTAPPPANPNPLFCLMKYLLWPILKTISSFELSRQIGSILLKALHPPRSAAVCLRRTAGGDFTVPQS